MKNRTLNQDELDEIMALIINTQGNLGYANGAMENDPNDEMSRYLQASADFDANETLQTIFDIIFNDENSRQEAQDFIKLKHGIE